MDFGMNLWQLPAVRMKLNHTLQQSIQVLQYSSDALHDWLAQQIRDNPMLDWNENGTKPTWDWQTRGHFRCDWMNSRTVGGVRERNDDQGLADWWMRIPDHEKKLQDDLREQLHMIEGLSKSERMICELMIDALDDDGYLRISFDDLFQHQHIPDRFARSCLSTLQTLEPIGVGARSIEECIALQLRKLNAPEFVIQAVEKQMNQLSPPHWKTLIRKKQFTKAELEEIWHWLGQTDPRPGIRIGSEEITYVTPDAWVIKEQGQWVIRWNPRAIPQLQISSQWAQWINGHKQPEPAEKESLEYLQEKRILSKRITHHLHMRAYTLQRVVLAILTRQEAFLERGIDAIQALEMQEIADELELHESTVSRSVQGKWIATPWGTQPLRMFFHSGIRQRSGKRMSPQQIQAQIKLVLTKQPTNSRMSDQMVVEQLQLAGIHVARRTVNKYRHQLGIPCSYDRFDGAE